jgi:hypothetical protein
MRIGDYALEQAARRRFKPAQRALLQQLATARISRSRLKRVGASV